MTQDNIKFYICPNCRQHFEPKTQLTICEKCNLKLMTNDEFLQYRINKNKKAKKANEKSNIIGATVCIIIAILVFGYFISIFTSPSEPNIYTCARCNKTFTDSANTKSIARTNFCAKCYNDYKFISEVQKELDNW